MDFQKVDHRGPLIVVREVGERLDIFAIPQSVLVDVDRVVERHRFKDARARGSRCN